MLERNVFPDFVPPVGAVVTVLAQEEGKEPEHYEAVLPIRAKDENGKYCIGFALFPLKTTKNFHSVIQRKNNVGGA